MQIHGLQWDTTGHLPFTPALQAFYVNGAYATAPHYGRGRVWIDVTGADPRGAMWLDVEKGDATAADVPGWLDQRRPVGEGGIYCNRSNLAAVEAYAGRRPHLLWVATLDGTLDIAPPPGIGVLALIQAFPAAMVGLNVDISGVVDLDYWNRHALLTGL